MKRIDWDKEWVDKCILCGMSTEKSPIWRILGPFTLHQCRQCHLVFLNPRPTKEWLNKQYSTGWEEDVEAPSQSLLLRLKNEVHKAWGDYPGAIRWLRLLFPCPTLSIVIPYREHGKVLDIGFGRGVLLDWLKSQGFETWGVEMSKAAVKRAEKKNHKVIYGDKKEF